MQKELRYAVARELRATGTGKQKTISGYACTWLNPTSLGDWDETIGVAPFSSLDTDNVVMNVNHNDSMLLGRKGVNLELSQDDVGLRFFCTLNDSSVAQDVYENIQSGILSECSFSFTVKPDGETWSAQTNGRMLRKLGSLTLWDTAIVTTPAYGNTSAQISRNIVAEDIQQRMAGVTLAADVAARKARAQAAIDSHGEWQRTQITVEMEQEDQRLKSRLAFLKAL
jgi:HK97 family phage prohead protease